MVHCDGKVLLTVPIILCLLGSSLLAQQPDTSLVERYSQEGLRALTEQRYADAETAYEKLRELEPGIAEVHANLGLIYFQEKKFEQAVPTLRQALKLKPSLLKADTLLAMALSELGRYSEALPGLEKGFRRSTDPALKRVCGLQLERAYTDLRHDSKAIEVALELNRLYPDDPEVVYHAGRLFGDFAYMMVEKLHQVAPTSVWMHLTAGDIYKSQGHDDLAMAEYRQVLALDPHLPGIHYRLGRALLSRSQPTNSAQDRAEASKEFEQELEVDPTNAKAAYELGEIHRKSGQRDKAEEFFNIALKYYPDFEEAQVGVSRVLIAEGKPELALPHLRRAVSLEPEDAVCYFHLAQVYRALGNIAEQQKALAEFQRLRSQNERRLQLLIKGALSPGEVTKQELDSQAPP
jgi:tetratricopeptide (TPR) repeat protein